MHNQDRDAGTLTIVMSRLIFAGATDRLAQIVRANGPCGAHASEVF